MLLVHTRMYMYLSVVPDRFLCILSYRLHMLLHLLQLRYKLRYSRHWCSKPHLLNSSTCCCSRSRKHIADPSSTHNPSHANRPWEMVQHGRCAFVRGRRTGAIGDLGESVRVAWRRLYFCNSKWQIFRSRVGVVYSLPAFNC